MTTLAVIAGAALLLLLAGGVWHLKRKFENLGKHLPAAPEHWEKEIKNLENPKASTPRILSRPQNCLLKVLSHRKRMQSTSSGESFFSRPETSRRRRLYRAGGGRAPRLRSG